MPQNRNQLIDRFVGNLANAIVHRILEKAIDYSDIINKYDKEAKISLDLAKKYRGQINPTNKALPNQKIEEIRERLIRKIKSELLMRISKGYEGIDLELVEPYVEDALKEIFVS